jgi:Holliday junction resolvase RusA-like endonuclease
MALTFTIEGAPRTKKNHGKRVKRGKRVFSVSSDAHKLWEQKALWQLRQQRQLYVGWPLVEPVSVRAIVYREANVGDLVGYLQAIGDALEGAGILADDKWIASWDGSRLLKDAARPRVEIEIVTMAMLGIADGAEPAL